MRGFRTHYDNLKVARDAPPEVIRSAYRALANKYHPDRNGNSEKAVKAMQAINASFEVLDDPVRRKEHDEWIERKMRNSTQHTTASRQAPPPEPAYEPHRQNGPYTYKPPPNPTLERNLGCFYWIVGFIALGVVGSLLDQCSGKSKQTASYSPPQATPTPIPAIEPTPTPRPTETINAPFGLQWGATRARVKQLIGKANAEVISEGRRGHQEVMVVKGIHQPPLESAIFTFVGGGLAQVEVRYKGEVWRGIGAKEWVQKAVAAANNKYGEGYRYKNVEKDDNGTQRQIKGWAWLQPSASLRLVETIENKADQTSAAVAMIYASTSFPPHESATYQTPDEAFAPFQVRTDAGSNFLIKLTDPTTRKDVARFYLVGGQEANLNAPLGSYELRFASGAAWYGDELLFGPQTRYAKADGLMEFTANMTAENKRKLDALSAKLDAANGAIRDYMVRNKFPQRTTDFIFKGRDAQTNLTGPDRLKSEWWKTAVLDKIGERPKLYNSLVDRLNARVRAANAYYSFRSEAEQIEGVTLTLYNVRGGNLEREPISAEEFAESEDAP